VSGSITEEFVDHWLVKIIPKCVTHSSGYSPERIQDSIDHTFIQEHVGKFFCEPNAWFDKQER
jgi:hypothetical protein